MLVNAMAFGRSLPNQRSRIVPPSEISRIHPHWSGLICPLCVKTCGARPGKKSSHTRKCIGSSLQNDFEQVVLDLIDTYNQEGLGTHAQVSILSYLCFELCNKLFMDVRLGYTHILSVLMQRMVYDMHNDQENKEDKKILH